MRNKLTKNLGLKIVSIIAAFLLWLVVVNVDDPIISKTYTGIPVEVLNTDTLTKQGKCYQVLDGSDTITVVVNAKRSVIDMMSKDYIRATADLRNITFLNTVPIDVRSTRYMDQIESITTRRESLKLSLENVIEKTMQVYVTHEGEPADGFMMTGVEADVDAVKIKGPESLVNSIDKMIASVDITDADADISSLRHLYAYSSEGEQITDDRLTVDAPDVEIMITINPTREIPISSGYSGSPVGGYSANGVVMTEPASVLVAGRGENFDDMDVIYISPDEVSIEGAMSDVSAVVNILDYLPTGVLFADKEFNGEVTVTVDIEPNEHKIINVPTANITVENVPEGYVANIVDIGGVLDVEIEGIGDTFDRFSGDLAIGRIDASTLVPRNVNPEALDAPVQTGENDGTVIFDLPGGISVTVPVSMLVIVDYVGVTDTAVSGETSPAEDSSSDAAGESAGNGEIGFSESAGGPMIVGGAAGVAEEQ